MESRVRRLVESKIKVPPKFPTFVCKASWAGTSKKLLIQAKDEEAAWDRAWKQIAREEGGDLCLRVEVLSKRD